jgi:hypothetical protein
METRAVTARRRRDLQTPVRNNYYFGKLLDVYHFELETNYHNSKRWLVNRRILGYGVVCGLNVEHGPNRNEIVISPGLAIDGWGREIIVPCETQPIPVPPDIAQKASGSGACKEDSYVQVLLCYHECKSDPTPILAGDCHSVEPCAPGTIREQYRVEFKEGRAPDPSCECRIADLICGGKIDCAVLARWVTRDCVELPSNPCIPLANLRITYREDSPGCDHGDIDISIRPIVLTNRLLFHILLCLTAGAPAYAGDD